MRDAEFCIRYCGCVLDRAEEESRVGQLFEGGGASDTAAWMQAAAESCTRETDARLSEPGQPMGDGR